MTVQQFSKRKFDVREIIDIHDKTGQGLQSWADGLAEWTEIKSIFLHRPGIETSLASLDFKTNLFLDVFYLEKAQDQHDNLVDTLKDQDINVIKSSDLVKYVQPEELENYVEFNEKFTEKDRKELVRNYIKDHKQLDILLTQPKIARTGEEELKMGNTFTMSNPLGNFFYARDPLFQSGENSFVISNMKYEIRQREAKIARLLFDNISDHDPSLNPVINYEVKSSETIEGGEVLPMGDTMIIGVESHRTSIGSVYQLMNDNALGHSKVGVVISPVVTQEEMHIDTWFNIIDDDLYLGAERFFNGHIDFLLYERDVDTGQYKRNKEINNFRYFLENEKNMELLSLNNEEQKNLMSNGLTIGPRKYIMIDGKSTSKSFYKKLEDHSVEVFPVALDELTDGHGGAHCMTQPINRELDPSYT